MSGSTVSPLAKYKLVSRTPRCQCSREKAPDLGLPGQVFLGDQSVGKTSIITRFMYDKFDNTYQASQCTATVLPACA